MAVKSVRRNNTDSAAVKAVPSENLCDRPKIGAAHMCGHMPRGYSDAQYIIWDVHGLTFPFGCDIII